MADAYQTLPDAILGRLRMSPVADTTDDTYSMSLATGQIGIGFDFAPPQAAEPYVVITEPGESRTYFTAQQDGTRPFLADGTLSVQCWAADGATALSLAQQVVSAINDAPLLWGETNAMKHLRAASIAAPPVAGTGQDSPTINVRVVTFEFMYQGYI